MSVLHEHARRAVLGLLCLSAGARCGDAPGERPVAPSLLDASAPGAEALAPEPLEIPEGAPTVVFLGDSVGAGLHLAEHQAFPAILQRRLTRAGKPFHLVSSCESGRTTAGGVTALGWVLRRKPDLVVVELGANDGLRGISLEEIERNLRTIVAESRESGALVLLLGVRIPPNYGDYARAFDALYPRLAEELDLPFLPFFMRDVGGVPEMNLPDGLHPTPEGHERLADNVQPALEEMVEAVSARGRVGEPYDGKQE